MTAVTASSEENYNSKIGTRRWLLLGISFLTSTLYAMTLLVVSVILPQIQGSLSATPDQIAWTVTFNILATAIVTPISGWLASRFGARNVLLFCMGGFGISSLACGLATSLEMLVIFRILQGGLGAPLRQSSVAGCSKGHTHTHTHARTHTHTHTHGHGHTHGH